MTDNKNIFFLIKKREKLLNDIIVFHEAFEIMFQNQNFKQIKEMFESILKIQKKIEEIDSELEKNKDIIHSSQEIFSHLSHQIELTKKILKNEKIIKEKLGNKISEIEKELLQVKKDKDVTDLYFKNLINKKIKSKIDKKI